MGEKEKKMEERNLDVKENLKIKEKEGKGQISGWIRNIWIKGVVFITDWCGKGGCEAKLNIE